MDRERNEDLNPHGDDIEEKVRRMLDPSVPDDAVELPVKKPEPVVAKPSGNVDTPKSSPSVKSAPTLPSKGGKTVSIDVTHHEEATASNDPQPDTTASKVVAPPVKKITITEHDETPAEVAEKLNEAIAVLGEPKASKTTPKKDSDKQTKPESDEVAPATKKNSPKSKEPAGGEEPATAPPLPAATTKSKTDTSTQKVDTKQEADLAEDGTNVPEATLTVGEAIDQAAANPSEIDDPAVLKDPETDKAVDDIIASESDEILEIEDAIRDTDEPVRPSTPAKPIPKPPESKPQQQKPKKAKGKKRSIFKSRILRWILLILLVGGLLAAIGTPKSRYFILNTAGVRAESSLTVLDDSTQQPLKNVQVSIGDVTGTTNAQGEVTLTNVKLGSNLLSIQKRAFAPISKPVTIGWGSNPLQSYELTPTGTQYEFTTVDYLSGKPVVKVEASTQDADAVSNDQGVIKLTLDKPADDAELKVTFKRDGYRDETRNLDASDKTNHTVKLVPAQKNLFVSKRSGKYDVYGIYVDGKDEKVVLAGTGSERDDMVLVPHPTEPVAAYVSTRGNEHNNQGFLLSKLTIINTDDNTTHDVVAAERIQLIDWSGDNLVYVQIASGESASSPKRYRLMSYNQKTTATKELAASNYFNDVVSVGDDIYYAPSSAYQTSKTALYKIKPDGSGAQTVFNQEVWNIIRTSYDHFALAVEQQWYDYRLGEKQPQKLNAAPSSQQPRVYISSPDGKHAAWIDVRDGKGVLLSYDTTTKNDTVIATKSGLTYPVRWLNNDVLVYRVKTDQETADYAISLNGGNPVKVRDVTNAGGIDRWYYY